MWSYLAVQRIRKRTTWSCTELWRTWIPWAAGAGWASSGGTPGHQWGARCRLCTPTVTGQRVPGRQTCPQCAQLCVAERPRNSPYSAWWSPRRSLVRAWWSGLRVPRRPAARNTERSWEYYKKNKPALLFKQKQHQWFIQMLQTGHFKDFKTSVAQYGRSALPSSFHVSGLNNSFVMPPICTSASVWSLSLHKEILQIFKKTTNGCFNYSRHLCQEK